MERKPPSSIGDFVAVIRRRKYWLIVPFVIVAGLGIGLSPRVPRSYRSTTTILVVPQKVPALYVRPSTSDVMNRLSRIGLKIMSGNGFLQIIDRLDLYPAMRKAHAKPARLIAAMRSNISVNLAPDSSIGPDGAGAFMISFIGPTPHQAQQATAGIAHLFLTENQRDQRALALGTHAFLTAQVQQAAQQLAAERAKIQAFKSAHLSSLPEQTQANLSTIAMLQGEMQNNSAAIDQDNQRRVYLDSVLNVAPSGVDNAGDTSTPAPPTALQVELAQKQAELNANLLKYTPQFPDVVRLKRQIAALKQQILIAPRSAAANPVAAAPPLAGPTMNDELRSQLVALGTDLRTRKAHQTQIEQQIVQLRSSVTALPAVQTEYAALSSNYEEMQRNYDGLLAKQQESGMAAQLEQNNDSEQFVVLDPANLPLAPYRPNPILLYMGSVFLGAFAGLLCALGVELRDDTIHDSEEAASYLKLPVMIGLPKCPKFPTGNWQTGTVDR